MGQAKKHSALVWPLGLTAGMLVVISFNIFMAVLAVRTDPGTSEDAPYERGVSYQRILDGRTEFSSRGWSYEVRSTRPESGALSIEVAINDRERTPVEGLEVSLRLQRPSTAAGDVTLALNEIAPGIYRVEAPPEIVPGLWMARLTIRSEDLHAEFDLQHRLP